MKEKKSKERKQQKIELKNKEKNYLYEMQATSQQVIFFGQGSILAADLVTRISESLTSYRP